MTRIGVNSSMNIDLQWALNDRSYTDIAFNVSFLASLSFFFKKMCVRVMSICVCVCCVMCMYVCAYFTRMNGDPRCSETDTAFSGEFRCFSHIT